MASISDLVKPSPLPEDLETSPQGVELDLPFSTPYGGYLELPSLEEISIEALVKMRRTDGQIRALMRVLTLPVRAALKDAKIVAPTKMDGSPDGGEEETEFIHKMLFSPREAGGMATTMERFIAQTMMALLESFCCFEMSYKIPKTGDLAGKLVLAGLHRRPPHTITWLLDREDGQMVAARQRASYDGRMIDVIIPASDIFYYAANEEENPYYGVSYFLPAYYHWDKKVKLYYLAHLAAQHRAVPGRVGTMPAGASAKQKSEFVSALKDYGLGAGMVLPSEQWKVEEFGKNLAQFPWLEIINHHNQQSSKSVLAQFMDDNDTKSMVDFSAKDDDMLVLELTTVMADIASQINTRIIPKFIDWNFGSGKYPKFKFPTLTDDQLDAVRELFSTLSSASTVQTSAEFVLELEKRMAESLGLEIDYAVLDAELVEEKEASKAMRDAAVETAKNPPAPVVGVPVKASAPEPGYLPGSPSRAVAGETVLLSQLTREVFEEMRRGTDDDA